MNVEDLMSGPVRLTGRCPDYDEILARAISDGPPKKGGAMEKMKKFWMVVGRVAPMVRHYNLDDAVAEAERICRKEKESVYIVEAMRYVIVKESPAEWTEMGG